MAGSGEARVERKVQVERREFRPYLIAEGVTSWRAITLRQPAGASRLAETERS